MAAVRRTVEKLDRAGAIRRKRLDQIRQELKAAEELTTSGSEQLAAELAGQRDAMEELNKRPPAVPIRPPYPDYQHPSPAKAAK